MIKLQPADEPGLDLDAIQIDGGTQSRANVNQAVVADYAEAIKAGADFPPIVVFYDGKKHWLADGFHRFHAYQKLGRAKVAADVRQGTRRDAILHSVGANEAHGLRRTNADKHRAVLTLLNDREWSKWSDGEIAKRCAVTREYVNRTRSKETCDQITGVTERVFIHPKTGESATMDIRRITEAQAKPKANPATHAENARVETIEKPAEELTSGTIAPQGVGRLAQPENAAEELTPSEPVDARTEAERDADAIQSAFDRASDEGRALFLTRNNLNSEGEAPQPPKRHDGRRTEASAVVKFQAKASEDNGRTSAAMCAPMAGEVSRVDAGRTASATSERMDVTARRDEQSNSEPDGGAIGEVNGKARLPDAAGVEPSPSVTFDNPRCQNPSSCTYAHSRSSCFDCTMAWSQRPVDEQKRLWAEAIGAAA